MYNSLTLYATEKVAIDITAAPSAFSNSTPYVIRCITDIDCHVSIGDTPTATTSDFYVAAGIEQLFSVGAGHEISVISADASTGDMWATEVKIT